MDKNIELSDFLEGASRKRKSGVRYRVIIDGIKDEYESLDSFCIKLSLFLRAPISRIKVITNSMPCVLWSYNEESKAKKLVKLVEEAGGIAHIEELREEQSDEEEEVNEDLVCKSCGFPLKEGEKFCPFCMTPVSGPEGHGEEAKERGVSKIEKKSLQIPPYRLFIYLIIVIVVLILKFAL